MTNDSTFRSFVVFLIVCGLVLPPTTLVELLTNGNYSGLSVLPIFGGSSNKEVDMDFSLFLVLLISKLFQQPPRDADNNTKPE